MLWGVPTYSQYCYKDQCRKFPVTDFFLCDRASFSLVLSIVYDKGVADKIPGIFIVGISGLW